MIKGGLAIIDQGLISGSNFILSILLARWVAAEEYGAYAFAFECFLFLCVIYSALVLEPMCVFGPSTYQDEPEDYLRTLLRCHAVASLVMASIVLASAYTVHHFSRSNDLPWSLAGVAIAAPCILFFWLVRRAMYVRLAPRAAVAGAFVYCGIVVVLVFAFYKLRAVSAFVVFLSMALGALTAGVLMLLRIRAFSFRHIERLRLSDIIRRHWVYGRWALVGSLVMSIPAMIYYPMLSAFCGLTETANLKALLNFSSPIGQFFAALFLLFLPYAARSYHENGPAKVQQLAWRSTLFYSGMAVCYWAAFWVFREPIMRFVYDGKYMDLGSFIPWVALGSVLQTAAAVQATSLRAVQSPAMVFVAFCTSGIVAVVLGLPAIWILGLRGAILTNVLASGSALLAASILLVRVCSRARETVIA